MNFSIGDPAPGFSCASSNNPSFQFDSVAGRYLVLCFLGSAAVPKVEKVLDFITGRLRVFFDDRKLSFFGVTIDPADRRSGRMKQLLPGVRYFWDFERSLSRLYGALVEVGSGAEARSAFRPFTLVLDPNLRVLDHIPLSDVETHNQRLLDTIASLPTVDAYAQVPISAPVLIVPRVFEPDFCRYLIDLYERHGGKESGSMIEKDGYTVGSINYSVKRRKDYQIDDENVRAAMRTRLVKRLVPEIQKAFQFKATHIERYIVACYESENRGFFRPHRDNTTKGTAHRRFACSINLNAEDYEGGALRFPEFGTRTYSAPTGGAVVFSCSLLHEATSVTAGRRYATLPFLYDAQAAGLRAQNRQFLTGEIIDSERPSLGASDQGRTPE